MITILSYGSGNVKAISNIYKGLNVPVSIAQTVNDLNGATKLVIPGVGAFDQTMDLLGESGMLEELHRLVLDKKVPVLGVCVGMQVMASTSEEGTKRGLGWIDGRVVRMDTSRLSVKPMLPHMGWNTIVPKRDTPLFADIDFDRGFYFLHSYRFDCASEGNLLATTEYGGEVTAAIRHENIYGFQFHPEKSHSNGINLFRNFAAI